MPGCIIEKFSAAYAHSNKHSLGWRSGCNITWVPFEWQNEWGRDQVSDYSQRHHTRLDKCDGALACLLCEESVSQGGECSSLQNEESSGPTHPIWVRTISFQIGGRTVYY